MGCRGMRPGRLCLWDLGRPWRSGSYLPTSVGIQTLHKLAHQNTASDGKSCHHQYHDDDDEHDLDVGMHVVKLHWMSLVSVQMKLAF